MEKTTINISIENWKALSKWKIEWEADTMDDVVTRLVNRIALQDEAAKNMKGMKKL